MKYIADFHIHSRYSRATSKELTPEKLDYWAKIKGINLIGAGDCTHPKWLVELKEKFEEADNGFYRLKRRYSSGMPRVRGPRGMLSDAQFTLSGEISSIYKKNGKVRKVHTVFVLPDFKAAQKLQKALTKRGANITSDGRPILGLDAKVVAELVFEASDRAIVIPAHIWTPWFSVLGSKSGFDSMEECYEDLTPHIWAVETGLSSDPPMNWSCSFLDRFLMVSFSDAHSPEKLGREATIFDTELSYDSVYAALKTGRGFHGTVEFFPEEGKYHFDGHRKCGICWSPAETKRHKGICPVCGKPVTRGVLNRVMELADRADYKKAPNRKAFYSITPLPSLAAELAGAGETSKKSRALYSGIVEKIGPDFYTLLFADLKEIRELGGERLAEGIRRLREGKVKLEGGYDGEFGRVSVF